MHVYSTKPDLELIFSKFSTFAQSTFLSFQKYITFLIAGNMTPPVLIFIQGRNILRKIETSPKARTNLIKDTEHISSAQKSKVLDET